MKFRVAARKCGYRIKLQNNLKATIFRLDHPHLRDVQSACVNTGLWDNIPEPCKRHFVVEIPLGKEKVWLVLQTLDYYLAFKGWRYSTEKAIRRLANRLEIFDEFVELVVYNGEAYTRKEAGVLFKAVKTKTPVPITLLLN